MVLLQWTKFVGKLVAMISIDLPLFEVLLSIASEEMSVGLITRTLQKYYGCKKLIPIGCFRKEYSGPVARI